MVIDLDTPPTDLPLLHRLLREMADGLATRDAALAEKEAVIAAQTAALTAHALEIDKLKLRLAKLLRQQFGAKSERVAGDQLSLGLEDLDGDAGGLEAAQPAADAEPEPPAAAGTAPKPARPGRKPLPDTLPREEQRHEPVSLICPGCGGALHEIGAEVHEQLEYEPATFKVIRHIRPRLACRGCETVHQVPAPAAPLERGRPGPGLLAQILIAKFCDHLPVYRQVAIYRRAGVDLDRSLLGFWIGHVCWLLAPLVAVLAEDLFALSGKLHTDETLLPVLDPGRGRTKSGRLWVYLRDDRPWNGPLPPAAVYYYSPDRSGDHAVRHLAGFTGFLQADAFPGYDQLFTKGRLVEVACMGHARRKFVDLLKARGTPLAEEAVRRIRNLYQIEDKIRGKTAEERQAARQEEAKPQLVAFKTWMEDNLARLSAKSDIAGAMTYALNNWVALTRYLDDGRLEIDNAAAERSLRGVAIGRKNYLFAGSDGGGERVALVYSLVETCRLNGIEPFAYLRDVIDRIAEHPFSRIRELLPYHWTPRPAPAPGLPQPP